MATFSPKRAMAELRHSSSLGSRASSSPLKREEDTVPLIHEDQPDDDRHSSRDHRDRPFWWHHFQSLCPYFNDETRVSLYHSKIYFVLLFLIFLAVLISIPSIWNRFVSLSLLSSPSLDPISGS